MAGVYLSTYFRVISVLTYMVLLYGACVWHAPRYTQGIHEARCQTATLGDGQRLRSLRSARGRLQRLPSPQQQQNGLGEYGFQHTYGPVPRVVCCHNLAITPKHHAGSPRPTPPRSRISTASRGFEAAVTPHSARMTQQCGLRISQRQRHFLHRSSTTCTAATKQFQQIVPGELFRGAALLNAFERAEDAKFAEMLPHLHLNPPN